jgi:hypothetical protein
MYHSSHCHALLLHTVCVWRDTLVVADSEGAAAPAPSTRGSLGHSLCLCCWQQLKPLLPINVQCDVERNAVRLAEQWLRAALRTAGRLQDRCCRDFEQQYISRMGLATDDPELHQVRMICRSPGWLQLDGLQTLSCKALGRKAPSSALRHPHLIQHHVH